MKAVAIFPKERNVRLIDIPEPGLPGKEQVKLRMLQAGVCGTDREIGSFQYGTPPPDSEFLILGHEAMGEVLEVGPSVTSFAAGDLAIPIVRHPCSHETCAPCREGRQDFCVTGDFTERGIKESHGFMTEMRLEDVTDLIPLPKDLRDVGVLVEPLTIAEKALIQVWDVQERLPWDCRPPKAGTSQPGSGKPLDSSSHRAVVLGAGPVGLLGAMALVSQGFTTTVYSRNPENGPVHQLCRSLGAQYISAQDHSLEDLAESVGNVDLVYEATGASRLSFKMLKYLGTNGIFIFTGVPGRREPVEVDTDRIMRDLVLKNQVLLGTVNAGRDAYEAAVRDLALFRVRWPGVLKGLITGRHSLEKAPDLIRGERTGIKDVIDLTI